MLNVLSQLGWSAIGLGLVFGLIAFTCAAPRTAVASANLLSLITLAGVIAWTVVS